MRIVGKFWKEISLVLSLAILYRDSFAARFFQDDKILLEIAKTHGFFEPIVNFPYRPVAIQIFYSLTDNPICFHIILFLIFILGLMFLQKLIKDWFVTLFVAFNLSLFPLFYWIATSYFSLAFFFVFAALYFYFYRRIRLALTLFILGLLSNEVVVVFPVLAFLFSWLKNKIEFKKLWPFATISLIYLPLRIIFIPFPKAADYAVEFGQFFATARWYILRVLNLPEGIRGSEYLVYSLFGLLVLLVLLNLKHFNVKYLTFALSWFFVATLPFFFLPNHMSAYYLTLSLFGPGVFLSKIMGKKAKIIFMIVYLALAFFGLEYLKATHWIILKNTGPIGSF